MNPNYQTHGSDQSKTYSEGKIMNAVDRRAAQIPTGIFFGGAIGSVGAALVLQLLGKKDKSHFVGQWVAPFLLLAIYEKLLKLSRSNNLFASA